MARSLDGEARQLDHSDIPFGIGHVTRTFNGVCSEAGVQCTVVNNPNVFDPLGSSRIYYFKAVGDRLVHIFYRGEHRYLEPGEETTLKVKADEVPEVRTYNYGTND